MPLGRLGLPAGLQTQSSLVFVIVAGIVERDGCVTVWWVLIHEIRFSRSLSCVAQTVQFTIFSRASRVLD